MQAAKAAPSSAHSNVRLAGTEASSLPVKVKDPVVFVVVVVGWPVIEVPGAVVSATVNAWLAGRPTLLASSRARTWKVWSPGVIALRSASEYVVGLVQAVYASASSRHSNPGASGVGWSSVELNVRIREPVWAVGSGTAGGVASTTVQVWRLVSALRPTSVAGTSNVCSAAERSKYDFG